MATFILAGTGYALLGGVAAVAAGALIELLRLLANPKRRAVIFGRPFRENLRQLVAPQSRDANQLGLPLRD